jgi:probable HAF family extracellular repeat protein
MKSRHSLVASAVLAVTSLLAGAAVQAEPRYRITPIVGAPGDLNVQVLDLNNRGDVVGLHVAATGQQRAFRWRNGVLTDLHDLISPSAPHTNASDINDRGTIVGTINGGQNAYQLSGTQVTPIEVIEGQDFVFPLDVNNRGQLIVELAGGPDPGDFFVDGDRVEKLPGLPNGSGGMLAREITDRGAVVGIAFTADFSTRAVLWQNGVLTELGIPAGFNANSAADINIFNRVAGALAVNFQPAAATWKDGEWTLLPSIAPGVPQVSNAASINDLGAIVGGTSLNGGESRFATLWFLGRAFKLDDLVSASDPLKQFVRFDSALFINNRGDIVSLGVDSRSGGFQPYFLRLVND